MLLIRIALLAGLALPGPARAQGHTHAHTHPMPPPAHGGIVAEATGEHWVELVVAGDRITAWVSDGHNEPIPSARLGGKATVLVAGRREEVALSAGEGHSLTGKLAAAPVARLTTVLALTINGKAAQVRFAMP